MCWCAEDGGQFIQLFDESLWGVEPCLGVMMGGQAGGVAHRRWRTNPYNYLTREVEGCKTMHLIHEARAQ